MTLLHINDHNVKYTVSYFLKFLILIKIFTSFFFSILIMIFKTLTALLFIFVKCFRNTAFLFAYKLFFYFCLGFLNVKKIKQNPVHSFKILQIKLLSINYEVIYFHFENNIFYLKSTYSTGSNRKWRLLNDIEKIKWQEMKNSGQKC